MKTMMSLDGTILRVSDEKASKLFNEEGFRYVAKSMWKEQVRDVGKEEETSDGKKKHNKMSKATKRHLKKGVKS